MKNSIKKNKGYLSIIVILLFSIVFANYFLGYVIIKNRSKRLRENLNNIFEKKDNILELIAQDELFRADKAVSNGEKLSISNYMLDSKEKDKIWLGSSEDISDTGYKIDKIEFNNKIIFDSKKIGKRVDFQQLLKNELKNSYKDDVNEFIVFLIKKGKVSIDSQIVLFRSKIIIEYKNNRKDIYTVDKQYLKEFSVYYEK